MTGLVGADTDELRALAADVTAGAAELRDLTAELARGIESAHDWQGPDASRCKDEWASFASVQMAGVADALQTAGALLEAQAQEQDVASGETSTGSGGWGWGLLDFLHDAFPLGNLIWKAKGLIEKGALLSAFVQALRMPATGFAALSRFEAIRDAMGAFNTKMLGGTLGRLLLPLTVWSGLQDVVTGHDYTGWRGWASRGFGAAGAAGAGVLIAGALGLVTAPVTLTVAGIGVVAYSAWSLGNTAWDNRQQIGDFVSRVWHGTWSPDGWARRQVDDLGSRLGSALDWARGRLAAPAPAVAGS